MGNKASSSPGSGESSSNAPVQKQSSNPSKQKEKEEDTSTGQQQQLDTDQTSTPLHDTTEPVSSPSAARRETQLKPMRGMSVRKKTLMLKKKNSVLPEETLAETIQEEVQEQDSDEQLQSETNLVASVVELLSLGMDSISRQQLAEMAWSTEADKDEHVKLVRTLFQYLVESEAVVEEDKEMMDQVETDVLDEAELSRVINLVAKIGTESELTSFLFSFLTYISISLQESDDMDKVGLGGLAKFFNRDGFGDQSVDEQAFLQIITHDPEIKERMSQVLAV